MGMVLGTGYPLSKLMGEQGLLGAIVVILLYKLPESFLILLLLELCLLLNLTGAALSLIPHHASLLNPFIAQSEI